MPNGHTQKFKLFADIDELTHIADIANVFMKAYLWENVCVDVVNNSTILL